jgi:hypothetical protein
MDHFDWFGYWLAAWAGTVLTGLAAVFVAWQGKWHGLLLLAGFTIVQGVFLLKMDRLPALVNLLVVAAGAANAVGLVWDLYTKLWWFDEAMHLYTPFALTLLLGVLARRSLLTSSRHQWVWSILAIASFGIAIGTLWEMLEWGYDLVTSGNSIQGKMDTMIDLVMDSIGAILAGWLCVWLEQVLD